MGLFFWSINSFKKTDSICWIHHQQADTLPMHQESGKEIFLNEMTKCNIENTGEFQPHVARNRNRITRTSTCEHTAETPLFLALFESGLALLTSVISLMLLLDHASPIYMGVLP